MASEVAKVVVVSFMLNAAFIVVKMDNDFGFCNALQRVELLNCRRIKGKKK